MIPFFHLSLLYCKKVVSSLGSLRTKGSSTSHDPFLAQANKDLSGSSYKDCPAPVSEQRHSRAKQEPFVPGQRRLYTTQRSALR